MNITDCKGDWALVTGASAGIGREFAMQLAAAGLNLVIAARRKPLLDELAASVVERNRVQARVICTDLCEPGAAARMHARLAAEGIRIRLLCNNAGVGRWGRFEDTPTEVYERMLRLNTTAVVEFCREFAADLASFPTSVIINVSSPAALQPVPYMAAYAASKAFVHSFSQALYGEWRERGVLVQTLVPGPTATEFDTIAGAYESALKERASPERVVKDSLLHLRRGQPVANSAKGTLQQRLFVALCPPRMVINTVARMFRPPAKP